MTRAEFRIPGGVGFCNAVRRSLMSDVESWAPYEIAVRANTTCQTDEFIAHRIGMIPLRCIGNGTTLTLDCTGPCTARARDLASPGFEAVHGDIEIMRLDAGQRLQLQISVDKRPSREHARYAMVAGVGMGEAADGAADAHTLAFETIDDRPPAEVLLEALTKLDERVGRALTALAHQPEAPPRSFR